MTKKIENQEEIQAKVTEKRPVETPVVETPAPVVDKVGGILKEARLKKGENINDIAKNLCIRSNYLEAIENSNYDDVPGFPYGVGFIRSYADYLGLNSARIAQLYKEETDSNSKNDKYFVLEPQAEATVPSSKYLVISLVCLMAIYGSWIMFNGNEETSNENLSMEETIDSDNAENPIIEEFVTVAPSTPAPLETEPVSNEEILPIVNTDTSLDSTSENIVVNEGNFVEPEIKKIEPVSSEVKKAEQEIPKVQEVAKDEIPTKGIFIKVNKETWVEVKDASKLYISKVLQSGNGYLVPQGEGMLLSVGKYEGTEVYVDGVLTEVVKPNKKMNINLDKFTSANH